MSLFDTQSERQTDNTIRKKKIEIEIKAKRFTKSKRHHIKVKTMSNQTVHKTYNVFS